MAHASGSTALEEVEEGKSAFLAALTRPQLAASLAASAAPICCWGPHVFLTKGQAAACQGLDGAWPWPSFVGPAAAEPADLDLAQLVAHAVHCAVAAGDRLFAAPR